MSPEQLAFFARNGFLRVGRLDPAACAHLLEQSWRLLPTTWSRDDSATWQGAVADSCRIAGLRERRGHLKFQRLGLHADAVAQGAMGRDSALARAARAMLGHKVSTRFRGLYMIAPFDGADRVARICAPHVEAHPVHLIATAYLHDVPEGAGGLLVWPGSHRALHGTFGSKLEFMAGPAHADLVAAWSKLQPIELPGEAGDVFFLHHRLLHAPSLNTSRRIRMALFCDYLRADHARLAAEAPGADPWEDWSPAFADLPRDAPADFALRPIPLRDRWPRLPRLPRLRPAREHHSSRNKHDASRLVRLIRAGETWVTVSTSPFLQGTARVEPCGTAPLARWVRVSADGAALASAARNDFVARLPAAATSLRVERAGWLPWRRRDPLWIRVIGVRLPFARSDVLAEAKLEPGSDEWCFAARPAEAATGPSPRTAA